MTVRRYYSAIVRRGRENAPTFDETQRDLREQYRQSMITGMGV
jgi:hypothetical protein